MEPGSAEGRRNQAQELGMVLDLHKRICVRRKQERQAGTRDASVEVERKEVVTGFVCNGQTKGLKHWKGRGSFLREDNDG